MLNSILYFEQFCIKNFEILEDEFLKNPRNFAEYVCHGKIVLYCW